jgi:beta-glucosidase
MDAECKGAEDSMKKIAKKFACRSSLLVSSLMLCMSMATVAQGPVSDSPQIEARINAALAKLSLEEKIDLIGGYNEFDIRSLPTIGFPLIKSSDGPMGVRMGTYPQTTAYPGGIGLAATWDSQLGEEMGRALGRDARARGIHILLAPGVNISRAPMGGRGFEYMGEDPFLAGKMAVGYIKGVQSQGVIATVKHFAANNEEYDRHNVSSDVDERTLREIYLPAFEMAVKEGHVGAIMDSYNLINGIHATQNFHLNCEIARGDWKFDGILMSDWDASYDGVAEANGCLDLEMPRAKFMNKDVLLPAIKDGRVTVATIDEKVRRILRAEIQYGFLDRPQLDYGTSVYDAGGRAVALKGALEGAVLLKNENNLLPLNESKIKTIAVIGPNAWPAVSGGGGSSHATPYNPVSLLQGLQQRVGTNVKVLYDRGLASTANIIKDTTLTVDGKAGILRESFDNADFTGQPLQKIVIGQIDAKSNQGVPTGSKSIRYTGSYLPTETGCHLVLSTAKGSDEYKVYADGKILQSITGHETQFSKANYVDLVSGKPLEIRLDYIPTGHHSLDSVAAGQKLFASIGIASCHSLVTESARKIAGLSDVVVLSVGFDESSEREGMDRTFELPYGQEELLKEITAINPKSVVVLNGGGAVDTHAWIGKTPVLLHAWYPGQEGGTAMAQLLFGDHNPEGKLPISFDKSWEADPTHDSYYADANKHVTYKEGVFIGYRYYTTRKVEPLFPFGYGLSYTSFAFSNLKLSKSSLKQGENLTVTFDVKNTGTRAGAEVAQVYVSDPSATVQRPERELKGFSKVMLQPGESKTITVKLDARAFSYYDVAAKGWKIDPGKFAVLVGDSSEATPLHAGFTVEAK